MFSKKTAHFIVRLNALVSIIENSLKKLELKPISQLIVVSISITTILEILSRRSLVGGLTFFASNPLMFFINTLIISITLATALFFKRRRFVFVLMIVLWLCLGTVNSVLLGFRTTPLTAIDFYILKSVFSIIHIYLSRVMLGVIVVIAILLLIGMIHMWRKSPKSKAAVKLPVIIIGSAVILVFCLTFVALKVNALAANFGNLADAFKDYGFAYCFSVSIVDRGINEPEAYSEANIDEVLETIENEKPALTLPRNVAHQFLLDKSNNGEPKELSANKQTIVKPNVIMVQLESFFDVNRLKNYPLASNPIPNFTRLKEAYSSGYLTVPSIGAGTANTEFEVITGMNLKFFGAGEYPYKTILQTSTCESISFNLGALGYYTHAIHNNTGTFYDRNTVFQKLGFNTYSSIEYMNDVEYNPLGWAKDKILTTEIIKALEANSSRDFVYAISVQPHGKYPDSVIEAEQNNEGVIEDKKDVEPSEVAFNYYINQLSETDQFVGELTDILLTYKEPTVVVFFGDHLPSMAIENEDLTNNNKFQTDYIIWSNFDFGVQTRDLSAYQLTAYLMERLGYDQGFLTKFHQRYVDQSDYEGELEMLQYDMLYGEGNVFKGENPYVEKPLHMGVRDIEINNVMEKGEVLLVEGINFTPWSVVYYGDEPKETLFIDEYTLMVPYETMTQESISVAQVSDSKAILSKSAAWLH